MNFKSKNQRTMVYLLNINRLQRFQKSTTGQ